MNNTLKTHDEFISQVETNNPNVIILGTYVNSKTKITCQCKKDGYIWDVTPSNLLSGKGCPKCAGKAITIDDVIEKINKNASFLEPLEEIQPMFHYPLLCKCKVCGYVWRLSHGYLYVAHDKCPVCNNKKHHPDINMLKDTHPSLYALLKDKSLGSQISYSSNIDVVLVCPNCGYEQTSYLNNVSRRGFSCKRCSDGISYPNKFMFSALRQMGLEFETEKTFVWSKLKRYDFFIPSLNAIIEVNGGQHYEPSFSFRDEFENDIEKQNLAFANSVNLYITIDARKSTREYIEKSISDSIISSFVNFNAINFQECDKDASCSKLLQCCNLYNSGTNYHEIAKILSVSEKTVWLYIRRGKRIGLCVDLLLRNRPVFCVEHNAVYVSIKKAKIEMHISEIAIRECCDGKREYMKCRATGEILHWRYVS